MTSRRDVPATKTASRAATLGALGLGPHTERRAWLLVEHAGVLSTSVVRESSPLVIGRVAPADVRIDAPSLSRVHARFAFREGKLGVEDRKSKNGLRVGV